MIVNILLIVLASLNCITRAQEDGCVSMQIDGKNESVLAIGELPEEIMLLTRSLKVFRFPRDPNNTELYGFSMVGLNYTMLEDDYPFLKTRVHSTEMYHKIKNLPELLGRIRTYQGEYLLILEAYSLGTVFDMKSSRFHEGWFTRGDDFRLHLYQYDSPINWGLFGYENNGSMWTTIQECKRNGANWINPFAVYLCTEMLNLNGANLPHVYIDRYNCSSGANFTDFVDRAGFILQKRIYLFGTENIVTFPVSVLEPYYNKSLTVYPDRALLQTIEYKSFFNCSGKAIQAPDAVHEISKTNWVVIGVTLFVLILVLIGCLSIGLAYRYRKHGRHPSKTSKQARSSLGNPTVNQLTRIEPDAKPVASNLNSVATRRSNLNTNDHRNITRISNVASNVKTVGTTRSKLNTEVHGNITRLSKASVKTVNTKKSKMKQ